MPAVGGNIFCFLQEKGKCLSKTNNQSFYWVIENGGSQNRMQVLTDERSLFYAYENFRGGDTS